MARTQTISPTRVETHRVKNRECMRRARRSQRQQLQEMKITVQQLEQQYAELCQSSDAAAREPDTSFYQASHNNGRHLVEAVVISKRLRAEKLFLQSMLKQKAAWRLQLQRILDFEASSISHEPQQLQGISEVEIDIMDEVSASQEFGFHSLTEQDLTQTILDNKRDISRVEHRLLLSSAAESNNDLRTHRMQAFGWDVVQRVEGGVMEFVCTKRFHGLNVLDVMQKTWANGMHLDEFKKVKAETRRLQALQRINSNAYVFARDVFSPSDISTFRSVFVRFLVETTKPISPDSDPSLIGQGYVLGIESVTIDCPRCLLVEDVHGRLAWASLAVSIEALDVVDPNTGETYQQIRWVGRTDYCSEEHAQRNASDTIQSMLRWEMLVIAPALNLTSLCLDS